MENEKKYIIKLTEKEINIVTNMFVMVRDEFDLYSDEYELYKKFDEVLKIIKKSIDKK